MSVSLRAGPAAPFDELVLKNGRVELIRSDSEPTAEQLLHRAKTFLEVIRAGAATASVPVAAEPAREISKQGILPATQTRLREVMAAPNEVPVDAVPLFELDDHGTRWVAQTLLEGKLERSLLGEPLGPHWAAVLRSATRAAEVDPTLITASPDFFTEAPWPQTVETLALLKRATAVFKVDPATVSFGEATVATATLQAASSVERSYDSIGTLINYLPFLRVARELARDPSFAAAVDQALTHVSLPDDVRLLVKHAFGIDGHRDLASDPRAGSVTPPSTASDGVTGPVRIQDRVPGKGAADFLVGQNTPIVESNDSIRTWGDAANVPADAMAYFVTEATDENLRGLTTSLTFDAAIGHMRAAPVEARPTAAQVLTHLARRLELTNPTARAYLAYSLSSTLVDATLPPEFYLPEAIPALTRVVLSLMGSINPDGPSVKGSEGKVSVLARARQLGVPRVRDELPPALEALSLFEPSAGATNEQKLAALERLQSSEVAGPSVVMTAHRNQLTGALSPIVFDTLTPDQQVRLVNALTADRHLGAVAAAVGLFTTGAEAATRKAVNAWNTGLGAPVVDKYFDQASTLSTLAPEDRHFVLAALTEPPQPDFYELAVRLSLAQKPSLSLAQMLEVFAEHQAINPSRTLRALADWAILRGPEQTATARAMFDAIFEQGEVRRADVVAALEGPLGERLAIRPEDHAAAIERALPEVAQADLLTRTAAIERLTSVLKRAVYSTNDTDWVVRALLRLYEGDLKHVMPLGEVDQRLGGVAAKEWQDPRTAKERLGLEKGLNRGEPLKPQAMQRVRTLKTQLELKAGADVVYDLRGEARKQGQALMAALSLDKASERAALDELSEWADHLSEELGR